MDDLLNEFLTETGESIAVIDAQLVEFEKNPNDAAILSNIFRLVHTIKGTSGFLGLPRLESVAHAGEDVLGKIRDGDLEVTPAAVTLILKAIDNIKDLLDGLESAGTEVEGDDSAIIAELRAMADGDEAPAAAAAPAEEAPAPAPSSGPILDVNGFPVAAELLAEVEAAVSVGVEGATEDELTAEMEAERVMESSEKAPVPAEKSKSKEVAAPAAASDGESKGPSVATQSIRVNVELLENLMTLVSELVLTRNQLLQMLRGYDDSEFTVPLQRLSHITTDLQEGVMKTRMQPIGNAWAKLPRIVRDLSVESGKKIDLQMIGAETELDRQVLELIKDPLTHMVRNSADHGLEDVAGRAEAGKPDVGKIVLSAYHEGGHIIIEISDDGRGLNMERIRDKVLSNGLATESEMDGMSDQQIQQFIFRAGFSTADKVTSVSGRGVGMDVVRTNIEKIGGTIELKSIEGKGSTFTIKIPLTLAIVSALIVACSNERFAIPQISVLELVRASKHSENAIEMINNSPVLRLRNRLLPLVRLNTLLKLEPMKPEASDSAIDGLALKADEDAAANDDAAPDEEVDAGAEVEADAKGKAEDDEELFIVVSQVGTYTFGIIVDRVFDTEEIVVKPVAPILRDISFYSGNTILGDGSVIMILDPNGIATSTGQATMAVDDKTEAVAVGHEEEKTTLLIFKAGGDEFKSVPLALVARLEDVDMAETEYSNGQYVVQYRGTLMPLIPLDNGHEWKKEGRQAVLVFTDRERSMGLVVDEIVDIVEDHLKVELSADQPGLIGSAIINGAATDVIDAGYYLTQAFHDWFGSGEGEQTQARGQSVLLVDDSLFFRNLLTPLLSVAGYSVTTVESASAALSLREEGLDFDAIISDIEMPEMNGFEFAKDVRNDPRWKDVPMVALSSHTSEKDFEKGRDAGFTDYVSKSDRDALVQTLAQTVGGS